MIVTQIILYTFLKIYTLLFDFHIISLLELKNVKILAENLRRHEHKDKDLG